MIPAEHPCLSAQTHFRYSRIHLSVVPKCNIRCGYCDRRYDCANEPRPGVTSEVISPEVALGRVGRTLRLDSRLRVAGVTGSGEPLANPATLEILRLIYSRFPGLLLCLSTNGLVLSDALPELLDCGVFTLTVTVNTRSVVCTGYAYRMVDSSADAGAMAAFSPAQQEGVAKAAETGLTVKVNTVVIPGVNTRKIEEIVCWAAHAGAAVMNLMPLIPQASFRDNKPSNQALLDALRTRTRVHTLQFTRCRQCRADAVGVPGEMNCIGCL